MLVQIGSLIWHWQRFSNCSRHLWRKIFLSAYVLAFLGAAYYSIIGVSRSNRFLVLLALPVAFNYFVFLGFYNFIFGLPLFLLFLGVALRTGLGTQIRNTDGVAFDSKLFRSSSKYVGCLARSVTYLGRQGSHW